MLYHTSKTWRIPSLLISWWMILFCASNLWSQTLTLSVEEIKQRGGQLVICLANEFNFLEGCIHERKVPVLDNKAIEIDFKDVPSGSYAISVFYDLNGNSNLDTKGIFKIPAEPFGFSQNPSTVLGPPKFGQCRFHYSGEDLKLCIKLKSF